MDNAIHINNTIDDFLKDHPEIDPSLKSLIEPLLTESEDQIFDFVMNFIF